MNDVRVNPSGVLGLADLDSEDGGLHSTPTEGVFHQGFDREEFAAKLKRNGFADIQYVTAHIAVRANGSYPIFPGLGDKAVEITCKKISQS